VVDPSGEKRDTPEDQRGRRAFLSLMSGSRLAAARRMRE
jgi:hypothetical protein